MPFDQISRTETMPETMTIGSPETAAAQQSEEKGITITARAVEKIRELMRQEGIEGGLRLGVRGGGCSGLTYAIQFDRRIRERDRIFEPAEGVRVLVDPKSYLYLRGLVLDYETTLVHTGFRFENPNAGRACGCGTSFSA
jgi:iron-sulfur cluster assembly protein